MMGFDFSHKSAAEPQVSVHCKLDIKLDFQRLSNVAWQHCISALDQK